jgi:hypothetical protein
MEHQLIEFESDFLEDGVFAVCCCGWKSLNFPDNEQAAEAHRIHAQARAGQVKGEG